MKYINLKAFTLTLLWYGRITFCLLQYICISYNFRVSNVYLLCLLVHVTASTLWADYIFSILNKSLSNHGNFTLIAEKALVVPSKGLKSHKLGAAQSSFACNGFRAGSAAF